MSSLATTPPDAGDFSTAVWLGKVYHCCHEVLLHGYCIHLCLLCSQGMCARVGLNSVSILQPEEMIMVCCVSEEAIERAQFAVWAAGIEPG